MNNENTYTFYLIANNMQTSKNITFSLHSNIFLSSILFSSIYIYFLNFHNKYSFSQSNTHAGP